MASYQAFELAELQADRSRSYAEFLAKARSVDGHLPPARRWERPAASALGR
jgi:hypothetical protein